MIYSNDVISHLVKALLIKVITPLPNAELSALPAPENKFLRRRVTRWSFSKIPTTHKCLIYMSDSLRRSALLFLLQGYISKWW